jgi:hypothetical protein
MVVHGQAEYQRLIGVDSGPSGLLPCLGQSWYLVSSTSRNCPERTAQRNTHQADRDISIALKNM